MGLVSECCCSFEQKKDRSGGISNLKKEYEELKSL